MLLQVRRETCLTLRAFKFCRFRSDVSSLASGALTGVRPFEFYDPFLGGFIFVTFLMARGSSGSVAIVTSVTLVQPRRAI